MGAVAAEADVSHQHDLAGSPIDGGVAPVPWSSGDATCSWALPLIRLLTKLWYPIKYFKISKGDFLHFKISGRDFSKGNFCWRWFFQRWFVWMGDLFCHVGCISIFGQQLKPKINFWMPYILLSMRCRLRKGTIVSMCTSYTIITLYTTLQLATSTKLHFISTKP